MISSATSTTRYVARLIAATHQGDTLGVHLALTDAEAEGVSALFLVTVLASMLQEVLAHDGYTLSDLRRVLLDDAAQD